MPNAVNAAFASWNVPPWATFFLLTTAIVYYRGWRLIRRTRPAQFPEWRLLCFFAGLFTLWLAIASPLDALSGMLLAVHMTQHLLLMSVAPPLVVLGAPQVPMLRGLPRFMVREGLGPFFTLAPVRALERLLKSRLFAWVAMNLAFLAWHLPAAYDLALAHPQLHEVEHACFFLTSVLFWWPVIAPWPVVYKGSRWLLLPYLMSADIVNTALSAFLSFSGRVVYPVYADAPRLFGISALNDQVAAGSLMWVLGSTVFLIPVMWITLTQVSRRGERRQAARAWAAAQAASVASLEALWRLEQPAYSDPAGSGSKRSLSYSQGLFATASMPKTAAAPSTAASSSLMTGRLDLFALPALGAFFKSRYGRQTLQALMLLASAAIIVDGFFGHPMSSMNLATVVPWTYARALFVLALLLVGNLFCMSCPFMLPRDLAKKLAAALGFARLPWPRRLRNKWLSAALLGLFFWAYEAFAIWDSPLRTAALLPAYFLTALTLDSIFRGASFCKYVCPLGQFNFVSSLLSPVSLAARSEATCGSCSTRDCIAGNERQRGCELDLFMPLKSGNLDCTLCMDCVKACPHDNIGLFIASPASELIQIAAWDPQRSSVGRYSRRADLAALALIVVAAAFASAAVMVTPVATVLDHISGSLPGWLASGAGGALAGLILAASAPATLFGLLLGAVLLMRGRLDPHSQEPLPAALRGAGDPSLRAHFCRWALALLPVGLGMWAAHLCFHLLTAAGTLAPALMMAAHDLHIATAQSGTAAWTAAHSLLAPDSLLQLQMAILDVGLLSALYLGWRMVRPDVREVPARTKGRAGSCAPGRHCPSVAQSLATLAPWAFVALMLYAFGVWILLEPMQMRGMMGM
jgi:cytochrome c oxidase assembly factor CtaG/polyferredoxin